MPEFGISVIFCVDKTYLILSYCAGCNTFNLEAS